MTDSPEALREVRARIAAAAAKAGKPLDSINLVAVTKTHGPQAIRPLLQAGHRIFGENRVQEARSKWPDLRQEFPGVELHLIGPLQSNKAAEAVSLFDVIESVDRLKIVMALSAEMARQNRYPRLFVQVNTGHEPQKAGVAPEAVRDFLAQVANQKGVTIEGLMCIPPAAEAPRRHFECLARLARENNLRALSMGMSGDYEEAIACGATHIRVGSALFGARQ